MMKKTNTWWIFRHKMGKRVKLSVFYEDMIQAYYGSIVCESPLEIEFENNKHFHHSTVIVYPESSINGRKIFLLKVIEVKGNSIVFEKIKNIDDNFFSNHYIEFKHKCSVAAYHIKDEKKYIQIAETINIQEINSTAEKLKEVYSRDDLENRELVSFLIDINAKIDEILHILKPKLAIEGASDYDALLLSEDGIMIVCNSPLQYDNIMVHTTIRDSSGFFTFGAVCKINEFYKTNNFIVYRALFINMNQHIQDKIIKYIFKLERDMLKEANK